MFTQDQARQAMGATAVGSDGERIGKVGQIFLDDQTQQPEWATVNTGLFGANESFVPLAQASLSGESLQLPYTKDKVKGAPNVDVDAGHLSESEEAELYRYYGMDYGTGSGTDVDTSRTVDTGVATGGVATGGIASGGTDEAMTRSEEQLRVGTQRVETGRARLKKYIVSENVTTTVPVTREEVRVVSEPITDANVGDALSGPQLSEGEVEVTLHEDRAVVDKEVVPVERVRLDTETVTEQQQVTEEVRKERIEVEGDAGGTLRPGDRR